jgi:Acetyltransferase (GNAT) domain
MTNASIQFLPRTTLDPLRWDACVAASPDNLIYAQSWYLDIVCPRWAGLVILAENGDYEAVMPVPLRRKFGQWVVHQPLFCQFLGVFARPGTPANPADFYRAMRQRVRYGSIFYGLQPPPDTGFSVMSRTNYVLDLQGGYAAIRQAYTEDRRKNLRRADRDCTAANGWAVRTADDIDPLLHLFQENHAEGIAGGVAAGAYALMRQLFSELRRRNLTTLRYAEQHGQPRAGALFVEYGGRIIYLFNAASPIGRQANARTWLLDGMLRERAGQPILFDFESPDVPDIARFYASFGAQPVPYWRVRYSRLTWAERMIQRLLGRGAVS